MADGPTWPGRLADALADGVPGPVVAERLDVLLRWMSDPDAAEARPLAQAVAARGLQPEAARQAAFALLDRVLFAADDNEPHRLLGLRAGADARAVQARYHRLVQLYHPDRNDGDSDWLTDRTERLNRAYSRLKRPGAQGAAQPPPEPVRGVHVAAAPRYPHAAYPREAVNLRRHLGSARQVRRRVLLSLAAASAVLLGYLYLVNAPYHAPETGGGDGARAPTVAEPGETVVAAVDRGGDAQRAPPAAGADGVAPAPEAAQTGMPPAAGSAPPAPAQGEVARSAPAPAAEPTLAAEPAPATTGAAERDADPVRGTGTANEPDDAPGGAAPAKAGTEPGSGAAPPARVEAANPGQDAAPSRPVPREEAAALRPAPAAGAAAHPVPSSPTVPRPAAPPPVRAQAAPEGAVPSQPAPVAPPPRAAAPAPPVLTPALRGQAERAVEQFAAAFERGDEAALAAVLAAPDAAELAQRLRGSVVRTLDVEAAQVTALAGGAARATVSYAERVVYADASATAARGTLVLGLRPAGGGLRVASIEHRDVERRDAGAAADVRALLERYSALYAAGRLQEFVGLFTADAVDNKVRGRAGLVDEYRTLFDSTRSRSLTLAVNGIATADGMRFEVDGNYSVQLEYRNGRRFEASAPIRMSIVAGEGGMRIERIQY